MVRGTLRPGRQSRGPDLQAQVAASGFHQLPGIACVHWCIFPGSRPHARSVPVSGGAPLRRPCSLRCRRARAGRCRRARAGRQRGFVLRRFAGLCCSDCTLTAAWEPGLCALCLYCWARVLLEITTLFAFPSAPRGAHDEEPLAWCRLLGLQGEMNPKRLAQTHKDSPERHLAFPILGPGSFHPSIPQPHGLPCCHSNRWGRSWGEGVLYLQGLQVHSLLTRTLQAQDLVPTLQLLCSVDR